MYDGNFIMYHENGQPKIKGRYISSNLDSGLTTWYANGQIKRKDEYMQGTLISGHCYTATGKDTTWFPYYKMFNYGNDMKELYDFFGKNLKYPKDAVKKGIEGKVQIQFIIEKDGTLSHEALRQSVFESIDKEALRAAPARWQPSLYDGEPFRGYGILPFVFSLERRRLF